MADLELHYSQSESVPVTSAWSTPEGGVAFVLFLCAAAITGTVLQSPARADETTFSIVMVGDVNMNRTRQKVRADGIKLWDEVLPFDKLFTHVVQYLDGDINFCNLETTVMDRNDIPRADKKYNFRSHPASVRAAMKAGFNLMSLANNHVYDYGQQGVKETLRWLRVLSEEETLHFSGAGMNREEASRPVVFTVKGVRVAFAAVSSWGMAGQTSGGTASAREPDGVLQQLAEADVDFRILSIHAGVELSSYPIDVQLSLAHRAIDEFRVNLVVGHHPHVAQGIELHNGGLVLYSLGNFVMRGSRSKGSRYQDFGLIAKAVFRWTGTGIPSFVRLKILPVTKMHYRPRPFRALAQARRRIRAVTEISGRKHLGRGSRGATFEFSDGWGDFVAP